jgi:hypothetical protein
MLRFSACGCLNTDHVYHQPEAQHLNRKLGSRRPAEYPIWLYCGSCGRSAPVALAPWLIRYGPTASSDLLRPL